MNLSDKTSSTDIRDLDEDEEVDEQPKSLVDKLKAKFAPKKKASAVDDDSDDDVKKKPEKKKINPVVLIVVLGGLGFFLFYEDEAVTPEIATETPAPKKIEKVPVEDRVKTAEAPADGSAPANDPAPTDAPATDAPVAETPTSETPATDPQVDTNAPVDPIATAPDVIPADQAPSDPVPADPIVTDPVDLPIEAVSSDPIDEPVITDTPTLPPESVDSVDGQMPSDDSSMTDKILEDLEKQVKKDQPKELKKEYVAPPDYEYKGRGLVYNCAGKHWACVDAPSYKTCEDNHSSLTFKKKAIECYPFNVYENTRGCEAMQNRVVSSNAKTGFCKGN